MPRILVIGAGGFLGENIVDRLGSSDERHEIVGLGRSKPPSSFPGKWIQADVTDLPLLESIFEEGDIVINCSGIVSYHPRDDQKMLKINEEGTANIVVACQNKKVSHLIHMSSIAVFGQRIPGETMSEKSIWVKSPDNTQYAISKFKSEQQVWRGIHDGLKATILNPAFILGRFNTIKSTAGIIQLIHKNNIYHPRGTNGFVDIDDVSSAVLKTLNGDFAGQRFILCGSNQTYENLYRQVCLALQIPFRAKPLPKFLEPYLPFLDGIRALVTGKKRQIFADTVKASRLTRVFDNSKSKEVLGISYTPFETTIQQSVASYLKQQ